MQSSFLFFAATIFEHKKGGPLHFDMPSPLLNILYSLDTSILNI